MRGWKLWNFAVRSVLLAVVLLVPLHAAVAQTPALPANPVARGAVDVLDKHCARCHQEGRLVDRERPAKNFATLLNLAELAANPHYVLPGHALGSHLFRQLA